ncbi:MAG TPA: NAD-dependent epimerase/dehydratase family protein, partial [Phycisphaerae bacterium]|nr:NAD-dependent epimerase/dehydratase family protein [Phycisphaerae bacterium]
AGIRTIQADLRNATAVRDACRGMEVVFHVGAITGIWGPRRTFWEINVEGTRNVIAACRECGIARLVYTSSPSVVFGEKDLCGVDESQPYPQQYLAHYPETKAVAERAVMEANCPTLATTALRPHLIWGPGDPHLIPRVVERARRGRLVQVGDGSNRVDITYVDNAADAHLRAADRLGPDAPCAGKAYFISQGEPVVLWPWLNEILDRLGIPRAKRAISYPIARRLGWALERAYHLLGIRREPRMTRFLASQLAKSHYFDISAARRDLGWSPSVTTEEGLERLLGALRATPPG